VICLTIVFDNVVWCPEALQETHVTHIAPEHLAPWPLKVEAAPLSVVAPTAMQVARAVLGVCALIPPVSLAVRQGIKVLAQVAQSKTGQNLGWSGCGPHHNELNGSPLLVGLRIARARYRGLSPPLD
jgi:hypothetical protein